MIVKPDHSQSHRSELVDPQTGKSVWDWVDGVGWGGGAQMIRGFEWMEWGLGGCSDDKRF